jgi:hypothetical protein
MNALQTKNGINTLYPYEKEKEEILKRLETWKHLLPFYNACPSLEKESREIQEFIGKLEKELKKIKQVQEKYLQLEAEYYDLLETKHQLETDKNHPLLGKINIRLQQLEKSIKKISKR